MTSFQVTATGKTTASTIHEANMQEIVKQQEKYYADRVGKRYDVSLPFVMYRIKNKGMTPYEALTKPKETKGRPCKSN